MCTEFAIAVLVILHIWGKREKSFIKTLPSTKKGGCHGAEDVLTKHVNTGREGGEAHASGF